MERYGAATRGDTVTHPTATTETLGARAALSFPVPDVEDDVDIKDFTLKTKVHKFRVDNDVFVAHAALGLPAMQDDWARAAGWFRLAGHRLGRCGPGALPELLDAL